MEMTLVLSRGGGHPGSFKYLISHWKICAVARGVGRIVIGHTFPLGLMQGEVVKAAERQKRQGWKWVAVERERESDREGK